MRRWKVAALARVLGRLRMCNVQPFLWRYILGTYNLTLY
eukprot:COSAG01_NODE_2577_length_7432_cov_285.395336_1_plen_39_part_00